MSGTNINFGQSDDQDASLEKPLLSASSGWSMRPSRLRALFFVTGCFVAASSQLILANCLWKDDILEESVTYICFFSFLWSFWTCSMVFGSLFLLLKYLSNNIRDDDEDFSFMLESHYIVGSILSVSACWFSFDYFQKSLPTHGHILSMLGLAVISYVLFYRTMTARFRQKLQFSQEEDPIASISTSYQLLAASFGLITGLTSQFLLNLCLQDANYAPRFVDNTIVFSLFWAILSVLVHFGGCMLLRLFIRMQGLRTNDYERIYIRMESSFVLCALIGICGAWIMMNISLGHVYNIIPTMAMLGVCILAFRGIVYVFPEEQCLQEIELNSSSDSSEEV